MKKCILALDQGTTSSRALIIDCQGNVLRSEKEEFSQIYPMEGWVEQNPFDILNSQKSTYQKLIKYVKEKNIETVALGIANQRETTIVWDKKTGKPVYNAIVWQDRRTIEMCEEIKKNGFEKIIVNKTGLRVDPYFSATKLRWILDSIPRGQKRAEEGELCFGTVDTWLLWNLTKNNEFYTDVSNASRTMLMNITTLQWDSELLEIFQIPKNMLPKICPNIFNFGYTEDNIPILSMIGDQQAALFGQRCFNAGDIKITYGTGGFLMLNSGHKNIKTFGKLIKTIAWQIEGKVSYALEGSVFVAGSVIQWLRDQLGIIKSSKETQEMALSVKDTGGVIFVPALTGLGAPHWIPSVKGTLLGMTRGTTKEQIVRAALEGIALQVNDVLESMEKESSLMFKSVSVDGGASENKFLMQFQADISNITIIRPIEIEATALGAAYLAGLKYGTWTSLDELRKLYPKSITYQPQKSSKNFSDLLLQWKKAIEYSIG